jgi:hypothetical protein
LNDAHGIAATAILSSLFEALVEKNVFSRVEARKVLAASYERVGPLSLNPGAAEAHKIVGNIVQRFM